MIFSFPADTCDSTAAMSGILKRKFEEVDGSSPCSSIQESDEDISGSESGDSFDSVNPSSSSHVTRMWSFFCICLVLAGLWLNVFVLLTCEGVPVLITCEFWHGCH